MEQGGSSDGSGTGRRCVEAQDFFSRGMRKVMTRGKKQRDTASSRCSERNGGVTWL